MKMLKKLLAVVLTGAMALTLLTACGGNAVNDKNIADAMNDMAKAEAQNQNQDTYITFTPQAKEREMARKIAALLESGTANDDKVKEILECKEGGANADRFVWWGAAPVDKLGVSGQAFGLTKNLIDLHKVDGKNPADTRYMGTALCKGTDDDGNPMTARIIVVTAAVDKK